MSVGGRPDSLFKYYPPERSTFLENGLIRFTPPSELNDPFEFVFVMERLFPDEDYEVESRIQSGLSSDKIYLRTRQKIDERMGRPQNRRERRGRDAVVKRSIAKSEASLISPMKKNIRKELKDYIERLKLEFPRQIREGLRDDAGVFSLTSISTSQPMWAHYAKENSGFLVEIDPAVPINADLYYLSPESAFPIECTYSLDRAYSHGSEIDIRQFFAIKNPEWQYEREWRYVAHQDNIQKIKGGGSPNLIPIDPSAVRSIILGARCSVESEAQLREKLSKGPFSGCKVKRAQWDYDRQSICVSG